MSKKTLFELHGFKVMSDSIYLVVDKPDHNAPSAFTDRRITKLPSDGVGVTFPAPYKKITNSSGVWDTGFDVLSPCYAGLKESVVEEVVKGLTQNVVEPYRRIIGDPNALASNNDEFFLQERYNVFEGKVYKTSNPVDVVGLYFALLCREVVPKERKDDSSFLNAAYMIIDLNDDIKKRDESTSLKFEAIGLFEQIYQNDSKKLHRIMYYLGRTVEENIKVSALRSIFQNYIDAGTSNTEAFLNLVKDCKTDAGMAKINIYYVLKTTLGKNPKISKVNGIIYYNDVEIGPDIKSAANNIAMLPKLSEFKKEILFSE